MEPLTLLPIPLVPIMIDPVSGRFGLNGVSLTLVLTCLRTALYEFVNTNLTFQHILIKIVAILNASGLS